MSSAYAKVASARSDYALPSVVCGDVEAHRSEIFQFLFDLPSGFVFISDAAGFHQASADSFDLEVVVDFV